MRKRNRFLILRITILQVTRNRDRSAHRMIMLLSVIYRFSQGYKSEALDNIHSLFKQNIKSCNAKRRRHATPEKGEKQQLV